MSSRDDILNSIRGCRLEGRPLSDLAGQWIRYADPLAQFRQMIEAVGGKFVPLRSGEELAAAMAALPTFVPDRQIVSQVPQIAATVDLDSLDDPHALETLDWAVLPGEFGVAENGAIWVTDRQLKHRAAYFIVQHLALVIRTDQIVHNLHEAYARVGLGESSLGLFISGPSKTADIEQSLVIGAHGPRSLTVFGIAG